MSRVIPYKSSVFVSLIIGLGVLSAHAVFAQVRFNVPHGARGVQNAKMGAQINQLQAQYRGIEDCGSDGMLYGPEHAQADAVDCIASFVVNQDGNVGIGTASPSELLHIVSGSGSGNAKLRLDSEDGRGSVIQHYNGATAGGGIGLFPETDARLFNVVGSDMTNANAPLTLMRNGNLGIRMSNPFNALHVKGAIGATGWVGAGCEGACDSGGDGHAILYADGHMSITGAAYKPGGGSWAASSDARLKDIQHDYRHGLDEVIALKPVVFKYKKGNPRHEPSDREFIGLVAQDVQKVFPEAVSKREDGYLDLDTTPVNYAVINAIKKLKAGNDVLRRRLEKLEAAND